MPEVTLNYWAIIVSVVACMALGFVWYAKPVFGRMWMGLIGKNEEQLKKGQGPAMAGMLIFAAILSYVMAHFVDYTNATTIGAGIMTGVWVWLGFVVPTRGGEYLFSQQSMKLFMINAGYNLVQLAMVGAILAAWK